MKVLMLGRGYVGKNSSCCGIFEFDQARSLVRIGYEVYILALDIRSVRHIRKFGIFESEKEGVKIFYISCPCGRMPLKVKELISKRALKKGYYELVKKYGIPDVLHSHFIEYSYYAIKTFRKYKRPIVVTEHSSAVNQDKLGKEIYTMGKVTYTSADKVICVSKPLAEKIEKNFKVKPEIIPNIVDSGVFNFVNRKTGNPVFTFIAVANLIPSKRIDFLVTVFVRIAKKYQNARLTIIGDGTEKNKITKLIGKYDLQSRICMAGNIKREKIKEYLEDSDCFVLPSQTETFGVSYIEAMATGLPVIATKCGGPEDFVNESNGILIEVDSESQLFEAMETMICSREHYNSFRISEQIIEQFSEKSVALKIQDMYKKIQYES